MPTRDSTPTGAPCWIDLMSSDVERSKDFYGQVFGWEVDDPGEQYGGYFNFTKDGVMVAGGMASQPGMGPSDIWSVYLAVDDAAATTRAATAKGGAVIVEPMAVEGLGSFAVVTDPGGAAIGMWQPGTHRGFGVVGEPGAPSWFELHTRDYETALAFYRDVFGWRTRTEGDSDDFRYTTMVVGEEQHAGVMDATAFLPGDVPAHWSVYFGVEDADKTIEQVVALGGAVVVPAEDTPYGRLATVSDPNGAVFRIVAG
jgi:predicted enzyme related to lactoylglutathione lyase